MLQKILNIINSSAYNIQDGTLFCNNYVIKDSEFITWLEEQNIIENTIDSKQIGTHVNLELSLPRLNPIGFYENIDRFILMNKYVSPTNPYYIEEIKYYSYSADLNEFINKYLGVISIIDSIKNIAKHTYTDIDVDNSLIISESKTLLLPFVYDATDIQGISRDNIDRLTTVAHVFGEIDSKKKWIYINELIDFLITQKVNDGFKFLLFHIDDFIDRANNAYQYYIRDFSYNKLKTELDNAALDYSKKIQAVINDAQTKLIAIPTAFVLAVASINFDKIIDSKNIGIVFSLFIFSWLIDLFIKNQKSALNFIQSNVSQYKGTFNSQQRIVSESFTIVDSEVYKQKKRLNIVHWITWGLPVVLTIILAIINFKHWNL